MERDTRDAITAMGDTILARMDHYFELQLRALSARSGQTDELRREIAELTVRVDQLERRQPD